MIYQLYGYLYLHPQLQHKLFKFFWQAHVASVSEYYNLVRCGRMGTYPHALYRLYKLRLKGSVAILILSWFILSSYGVIYVLPQLVKTFFSYSSFCFSLF